MTVFKRWRVQFTVPDKKPGTISTRLVQAVSVLDAIDIAKRRVDPEVPDAAIGVRCYVIHPRRLRRKPPLSEAAE